MSGLPELLNFVITTLQRFPRCQDTRIMATHLFSERQFALKVRATLTNGQVLQVYIYRNHDHTDYAYQLLRNEQPMQRWDNREHFPNISSYPHHFHALTGNVENSPLNGDPAHDLPLVLQMLSS